MAKKGRPTSKAPKGRPGRVGRKTVASKRPRFAGRKGPRGGTK